jgi:hypothetical protein
VEPGDGDGRHLAVVVVGQAQRHTFGAHLSGRAWLVGQRRCSRRTNPPRHHNDHGPSVCPGRGGLK